uniref:Phlebovirus_G2 domain-containing protein n=1 Tax=Heterorhabditis bacteriophora TaxID=37862 RepID=A0A1I7WR12_HETBA
MLLTITEGYVRGSTNVICQEDQPQGTENCYMEYNEELFFNSIHKSFCLRVKHQNTSIGFIEIMIKPLKQTCQKVSKFFTRDTTPKVYSSKRCPLAGSCHSNTCTTIRINQRIPELNNASSYPGNVRCSESCAGWFCGCALPGAACMFYKVAHIPKTKLPYEFFRCASWTQQVELSIVYAIGKYKVTKNLVADTKIRVTSITTQNDPLMNSIFAETADFTVIVPDTFTTAVRCVTKDQARNRFASCSTDEVCLCTNNSEDVECVCKTTSLATLHSQYETTIPIKTPKVHLYSYGSNLIAETNQAEIMVAIQSKTIIKQSIIVKNPKCSVSVSPAEGCYKCLEGARIPISCYTPIPAILEIQCLNEVFMIRCGPQTIKQELKFYYNSAIIVGTCTTHCGNTTISLVVEGILMFHSENDASIKKLQVIHQWHNQGGAPDLTPLLKTIQKHWGLALTAATVTIMLMAGTYLGGPFAMIFLLNLAAIVGGKCIAFPISVLRRIKLGQN